MLPLILFLLLATAVFGWCFIREPRRLVIGWLFNCWLVLALTTTAMAILRTQNRLLVAVSITLFVLFVLLVLLVFALHLVWLLWNAWVVWRRESHSLGNMLTLLLALALLALELGATIGRQYLPTPIYVGLGSFILLTGGYVLVTLYNFLTVLGLYNLRPVLHNRDYLIILGAGLLEGERVSPLLAARINAGLRFYHRQIQKTGHHPILIFSGGQGPDEKLPEAVAMQRYALTQGIPEADTLVEAQSTTTLENMRFSAALIAKHQQGRLYRAAFFTNNYHLLRAGLFAKQANLPANGVGAATSFYFLPNAIIREYVAVMLLHKRRHLVALALITLISLGFLSLQFIN